MDKTIHYNFESSLAKKYPEHHNKVASKVKIFALIEFALPEKEA